MADSLRGGSTVGGYPIVTKSQVPFSFRESGEKLQYALDGINYSDVEFTGDATAAAGDMLSGKTGYVGGIKISGTMTNRGGATTVTPSTSTQTKYSGYYSGNTTISGDADLVSANIKSGKNIFGVAGNSNVVDTSAGTAIASQILDGEKAYVDGALRTGTMENVFAYYGRPTINAWANGNQLRLDVGTAGFYNVNSCVTCTDDNWIESNIKSGVNIFGKVGTVAEGISFSMQDVNYFMYGDGRVEDSVPINYADPNKSVVILDSLSHYGSAEDVVGGVLSADGNNLLLKKCSTGGGLENTSISTQIVTFENLKSFQKGTTIVDTTGAGCANVDISGVTVPNAILFWNYHTDYTGSMPLVDIIFGGYNWLKFTSYIGKIVFNWWVVEIY